MVKFRSKYSTSTIDVETQQYNHTFGSPILQQNIQHHIV
jgi:hypothetical protein